MHQCVPDEVTRLAAVEQVVKNELATSRQLLRLHHALQVISEQYVPAGPLEEAIRDGERQLDAVKARGRALLRQACQGCPDRAACPSRIT